VVYPLDGVDGSTRVGRAANGRALQKAGQAVTMKVFLTGTTGVNEWRQASAV
jgi:hypothetical protein